MNPRRHSSIRRLLALFAALAALIVVVSLLALAVLDWERVGDGHEREISSGYQFARALIQERLFAARLLARQAAEGARPADGVPSPATVLVLDADGTLLSSSSGRSLPRLSTLAEALMSEPSAGIEVDDQGSLVAVGTFPQGRRLVVAALPFTAGDAQAIKDSTGLESSFLAGPVRVATTLRDAYGEPAAGSAVPDGDWEALIPRAGRLQWASDPGLAGAPYLQVQLPLYGLDGSLVGGYVAGRSAGDYQALLWRRLGLWLGILLGVGTPLGLLVVWLGRRLLRPVDELQRALAALAGRRDARSLAGQCGLAELDELVRVVNQLSADRAALWQENKQLNEQLIQSQTLTALGQVAAGVAHDLNNPLTTIMGLAEIVQTAGVDADAQRELAIIYRQAERSARIVRSLLSFARRQRAELQWVSVNDLISQTLELLAYQARVTNIRCELELDPDLPLTWADPSQLQQVFFNLINNAMQAMAEAHEGGNLRIESSWSSAAAGAPYGRIAVRVQDDGPGIPDHVWPHLFQPYFTTKGPSGGTGLGLMIASNIVRRHSGRIWAENNAGKGASFHVQIPVAPEPPQGPARPPGGGEGGNGDCRILLADSDAQRVSLLSQMLRRQGHFLATAGDGLLARHKLEVEAFDLVLCALEMSRLDGRGLYAWARAHQPQLAGRFIFIASENTRGENEAFLQASRALVLRPPWPEETVKAVVGQALGLNGGFDPSALTV